MLSGWICTVMPPDHGVRPADLGAPAGPHTPPPRSPKHLAVDSQHRTNCERLLVLPRNSGLINSLLMDEYAGFEMVSGIRPDKGNTETRIGRQKIEASQRDKSFHQHPQPNN